MPKIERRNITIKSVACCAQCQEPKWPAFQTPEEERVMGKPGCVNPMCIAFGEQQSSVSFLSPTELAFGLQARLNRLREYLQSEGYEFTWRPKESR